MQGEAVDPQGVGSVLELAHEPSDPGLGPAFPWRLDVDRGADPTGPHVGLQRDRAHGVRNAEAAGEASPLDETLHEPLGPHPGLPEFLAGELRLDLDAEPTTEAEPGVAD